MRVNGKPVASSTTSSPVVPAPVYPVHLDWGTLDREWADDVFKLCNERRATAHVAAVLRATGALQYIAEWKALFSAEMLSLAHNDVADVPGLTQTTGYVPPLAGKTGGTGTPIMQKAASGWTQVKGH